MQPTVNVAVGVVGFMMLASALMLSETANEFVEHKIVKG